MIRGQKYLVTTEEYFVTPNGKQYKAAFGEYKGKAAFGVDFTYIGNIALKTDKIYSAVKTDEVDFGNKQDEWSEKGEMRDTWIYNAE